MELGQFLRVRNEFKISDLKSMVFQHKEDPLLELVFSETICIRILDDAARQQWRRAFSIVFSDAASSGGKAMWSVSSSEQTQEAAAS